MPQLDDEFVSEAVPQQGQISQRGPAIRTLQLTPHVDSGHYTTSHALSLPGPIRVSAALKGPPSSHLWSDEARVRVPSPTPATAGSLRHPPPCPPTSPRSHTIPNHCG
ncbi:hypothetical protein GCM10023205_75540 [Yinghuangia aomiensis]|uniref:Uncharacterized protein n=1 Tax=Yinghuangia aomiensis TaxID=676205 RepID=A0ABP9IAE0_9ACTN